MSLSAICPQCSFSREVDNSLAGRKAKCPKCATIFVIGKNTVDTINLATDTSLATNTPQKEPPQNQSAPLAKNSAAKPTQNPQPKQTVHAQKTPPAQTTFPAQATTSPAQQTAANTSVNLGKTQKEKIPNPLVPVGGTMFLCPTLQTHDELNSYRASLLTPLQTPLKVKKMTFAYKCGLFLTGFFMILLPLVYVALIAGLCFLVYLFFTTSELQEAASESGKSSGLLFYISIPVALCAVIIILLRPLIFGWGGKDTRFEISREREPLFFDFVQHYVRLLVRRCRSEFLLIVK
ncbi:MAG: hypothetical protein LBQ66_12275 [Planctomycetaceae bacterium]|jgi:hypothetical protein|nr:hypothetical protein [Planctomycetaceae bacterium]